MYLLFDIGGTNTRVAVSSDGKAISEYRIFETPKDFGDGVKSIIETGKELAGSVPFVAAGGGIAGSLNAEKSGLIRGGHLSLWEHKPFTDEISAMLGGIPVFIENDAAVVGLGEAHDGAGKGLDIVVYITISTGVGGARIVGGMVDVNRFGFEPGHQIVDYSGNPKQLERLVSGSWLSEKLGRPVKEVTDVQFWNDTADVFSAGLVNSILHWSPDVVILGGSMMKEPGIPLPRVKEKVAEWLHDFPNLPEIKKAELADIGGLHGALVLVNQGMARV